jgi:hypothetical protein
MVDVYDLFNYSHLSNHIDRHILREKITHTSNIDMAINIFSVNILLRTRKKTQRYFQYIVNARIKKNGLTLIFIVSYFLEHIFYYYRFNGYTFVNLLIFN